MTKSDSQLRFHNTVSPSAVPAHYRYQIYNPLPSVSDGSPNRHIDIVNDDAGHGGNGWPDSVTPVTPLFHAWTVPPAYQGFFESPSSGFLPVLL